MKNSYRTDAVLISAIALAFGLLSSRHAQAAPVFFTSPGSAAGGDSAFRAAAGNPTRVSFDVYSDAELLSTFVSDGVGVSLALLDATGNVVATNCEIYHPPVWNPPAGDPQVVGGGVLGSFTDYGVLITNKMRFVFSEPVASFGLWIFDDGFEDDNVFRLRVTETNGVSTVSPTLDATNGFSNTVEGFLGVVSALGLSSVVVESTHPGGSPSIAGFEVDNVQLQRNRNLLIWPAVELGFASASNALYQVRYSTNLSTTNWFDLGTPVTGNGQMNFLFDSTRGSPQKFYRVVPLQ